MRSRCKSIGHQKTKIRNNYEIHFFQHFSMYRILFAAAHVKMLFFSGTNFFLLLEMQSSVLKLFFNTIFLIFFPVIKNEWFGALLSYRGNPFGMAEEKSKAGIDHEQSGKFCQYCLARGLKTSAAGPQKAAGLPTQHSCPSNVSHFTINSEKNQIDV
jgi:hypothetical protein